MKGPITGEFHQHETACFVKRRRISWTAIFIGALTGIGLSFILHLFNIAIGLSIFNETAAGMTVAVGGLLGLLIGVIIAMFVAGFVAGFLGRDYCFPKNYGVIYGFATWSLILIFMVFFSMHMGRYAEAYSSHVSNPIVVTISDNTAPAMTTTMNKANKPMIVMNKEKAMTSLGAAAFIVFFVFIIGALASCFGGYAGVCCCCKDNDSGCCK